MTSSLSDDVSETKYLFDRDIDASVCPLDRVSGKRRFSRADCWCNLCGFSNRRPKGLNRLWWSVKVGGFGVGGFGLVEPFLTSPIPALPSPSSTQGGGEGRGEGGGGRGGNEARHDNSSPKPPTPKPGSEHHSTTCVQAPGAPGSNTGSS